MSKDAPSLADILRKPVTGAAPIACGRVSVSDHLGWRVGDIIPIRYMAEDLSRVAILEITPGQMDGTVWIYFEGVHDDG